MTSLINAPLALSYRLPIANEPLNCLVSEIFSIKFADKQTERDTSTDKGRLMLAARAPTFTCTIALLKIRLSVIRKLLVLIYAWVL